MPFRQRERIWRSLYSTRLIRLAECNLFCGERLGAMDCCPTGGRVPAAYEFLIDVLVARAAIARSQVVADSKPMMVHLLLSGRGLVAIKAGDALLRVHGKFVVMDHGVLQPRMALSAFS